MFFCIRERYPALANWTPQGIHEPMTRNAFFMRNIARVRRISFDAGKEKFPFRRTVKETSRKNSTPNPGPTSNTDRSSGSLFEIPEGAFLCQ
jgi:hypothetical protein